MFLRVCFLGMVALLSFTFDNIERKVVDGFWLPKSVPSSAPSVESRGG